MKKTAVLCSALILICMTLLAPAAALAERESAAAAYDENSIDLDLSLFSATFVYAQIYQI